MIIDYYIKKQMQKKLECVWILQSIYLRE